MSRGKNHSKPQGCGTVELCPDMEPNAGSLGREGTQGRRLWERQGSHKRHLLSLQHLAGENLSAEGSKQGRCVTLGLLESWKAKVNLSFVSQ